MHHKQRLQEIRRKILRLHQYIKATQLSSRLSRKTRSIFLLTQNPTNLNPTFIRVRFASGYSGNGAYAFTPVDVEYSNEMILVDISQYYDTWAVKD